MPLNEEERTSNEWKPEVLAQALASLEFLVLERKKEEGFRVQGRVPQWAKNAFGNDVGAAILESPFVANFVESVASPLWEGSPSPPLNSGIWSEAKTGSCKDHLEAFAVHAEDGERLLLVRRLGADFDQLRALTQRANENSLEHRHLSRETQKKDVLLKCIIHDISNPLNAMLLNLQLLSHHSDPEVRSISTLAFEAARRQRNLIKSISEIFSSDVSRLDPDSTSVESVSEVIAAADLVVRIHLNEAMRRSVSISLEDGLTGRVPKDLAVRAEREALLRAVENLVLNALRYAPRDSTVKVRLEPGDEAIRVQVIDSGPGVEPELVETLFDPFTQGTGHRGSMGLGLYFCRMTIERWKGRILYEPAEGGGARFVFTLPVAPNMEGQSNGR